MPLITHLLNVEELSRLLKNVALSVINLFILDDVSEKMEYVPRLGRGYPVKHLVALINLAGHILLNAVTVPYRESEIVVF
ncbi:TPA: hypothetical protein JLG11_004348 [Escherichia coli]|uniref:Uncharacterized protein n=1 Tax=Escherichia coli TaxID=562 RepID=A0A229ASY2_ECOLX|nr:hypothetical protein [Escherichia coli]MKY49723.1 hypothetical protein [Escherichia coli]NJU06909.1 hypothetical protein [Escherichia coli]OXK54136.1 hypothetical protein CDL37_00325 [Escherichia coli]OZC25906.1 hypothetical protein AYO35_17190 [Escherichia coli]